MWRKFNKLLSTIFPSLILLSFFAVSICFINQWDSLIWITVIPIWFWSGIGIMLSALSWIFFRSNAAIFTLCLCLIAGVIFSEETRYLLRDSHRDIPSENQIENGKSDGTKLRIVTINCNNGNFKAAQTAAALDPDIVFLQECPLRPEISQIAAAIFGKDSNAVFAMSPSRNGNAIIARGEFLTETVDDNSPTLHARLRLPSHGQLLDLTNVNLQDCLPSRDLWKRKIRRELTMARISNRRELRSYMNDYDIENEQPPRIVAGDFSTPPGDDIFRTLKDAGLADCFPVAGKGWGNTFTAETSFLRIDQIWMSPDLISENAQTVINPHSKHRIVVCDFLIKSKK